VKVSSSEVYGSVSEKFAHNGLLHNIGECAFVRKAYTKLHCEAMERLFSQGGKVFSPFRTRILSKHFEMMLFLRIAKF